MGPGDDTNRVRERDEGASESKIVSGGSRRVGVGAETGVGMRDTRSIRRGTILARAGETGGAGRGVGTMVAAER